VYPALVSCRSLLLWVSIVSTVTSQNRDVQTLVGELASDDAAVRARAACELKKAGDRAAEAIAPLVQLLADASPVDRAVCREHWWRGSDKGDNLTSPGEQAAAALVGIGTRAFQPLMASLQQPVWVARRNAAWALGALDDMRAVPALVQATRDREPGVREQAAWALGAIDSSDAIDALAAALKDSDARVRRQAAWALGALDANAAVGALTQALSDSDDGTRHQAAWALGAIGDPAAVDGLVRALRDANNGVREQAAWALGAIGDSRAVPGLVAALKDADASVRRQAAWAIGAIGK
jgi:HEAT repeat protein